MKRGVSGGIAAVGVGLRQYPRGGAPIAERGVVIGAILDACQDAGLDPSEIDGFASYADDANEPIRMMPDLGLKELRWSSMVYGGGGGGIAGAIGQAAGAILTDQASAVIVYRGMVQGDSGRMSASVMAHHLNEHLIGAGLVSPAQVCALRAKRLFEHHRVPPETAEAIVRADYYHAARNSEAVAHGSTFSHDAYAASRMIAEPFRLLDCSRENDGAGAVLFVSAERARDLRKPPAYVLGVAQGAAQGWGDLLENDDEDQYATVGFKSVAKHLWTQSGLTPSDIDVAQIYENFSAQAVASIIDHGFCTVEEAGDFISFENLIAPHGKLPINTSGGNIGQGFIHGIGTLIESVRVLRAESSNPVPGAKTCLLAGGPGAPLVSSAILGTEVPD
tara:strand:+ start:19125 stop:20297 length:1173 start_codon:yes stop_codon:yes gene_type:complete